MVYSIIMGHTQGHYIKQWKWTELLLSITTWTNLTNMQRRKRQTEKEYIVQNPLSKVSLKIRKLMYPVRSPNNSSIWWEEDGREGTRVQKGVWEILIKYYFLMWVVIEWEDSLCEKSWSSTHIDLCIFLLHALITFI